MKTGRRFRIPINRNIKASQKLKRSRTKNTTKNPKQYSQKPSFKFMIPNCVARKPVNKTMKIMWIKQRILAVFGEHLKKPQQVLYLSHSGSKLSLFASNRNSSGNPSEQNFASVIECAKPESIKNCRSELIAAVEVKLC